MQSIKSWKMRTMTGSAMLAGIYGFAISLGRVFDSRQRGPEDQKQPVDSTLCYRGIPNSSPSSNLAASGKIQNRWDDDSLCYRGIRTSLSASNEASLREHQNQLVEPTMYYRGVRCLKRQSASA